MITRISRFIYSCCIAGLMCACVTGCDLYPSRECPSYVVFYNNMQSIDLHPVPKVPGCLMVAPGYDVSPSVLFSLLSEGEEKAEYDRLCEKHCDLSFNRRRTFLVPSESVGYNDKDFVSIEITSDAAFDESHPAGTNLADVVRFMSWSPREYIASGYLEYYHYDPSGLSDSFKMVMPVYLAREFFLPETDATCYPIDKMVCDLEPEDLILLGHDDLRIGFLKFERMPANPGNHIITVKMETDAGAVFEKSIEMTF